MWKFGIYFTRGNLFCFSTRKKKTNLELTTKLVILDLLLSVSRTKRTVFVGPLKRADNLVRVYDKRERERERDFNDIVWKGHNSQCPLHRASSTTANARVRKLRMRPANVWLWLYEPLASATQMTRYLYRNDNINTCPFARRTFPLRFHFLSWILGSATKNLVTYTKIFIKKKHEDSEKKIASVIVFFCVHSFEEIE